MRGKSDTRDTRPGLDPPRLAGTCPPARVGRSSTSSRSRSTRSDRQVRARRRRAAGACRSSVFQPWTSTIASGDAVVRVQGDSSQSAPSAELRITTSEAATTSTDHDRGRDADDPRSSPRPLRSARGPSGRDHRADHAARAARRQAAPKRQDRRAGRGTHRAPTWCAGSRHNPAGALRPPRTHRWRDTTAGTRRTSCGVLPQMSEQAGESAVRAVCPRLHGAHGHSQLVGCLLHRLTLVVQATPRRPVRRRAGGRSSIALPRPATGPRTTSARQRSRRRG